MLSGLMRDREATDDLIREGRRLGLYFYFREIVSDIDTVVTLKDGRQTLMLGSNSYMGLTTHPEVKAAAAAALDKYGTGCAGSRFLNGTLDIHTRLEEQLADWVGKESAIVFSTGFQVNQGVIPALVNRHDILLTDMNNHASIMDGARVSMARIVRFPHNDTTRLARILQKDIPAEKGKLIVVDGVFSMEGDLAPLPQLAELARTHQAALMVDDAHGLGVLGPDGAGTAAHFGVARDVDLVMGTFSKSLASIGGFVAGERGCIERLKHSVRPFIFSASMPASSAAAALAALKIIRREPERIERLWDNTRVMRQGLAGLGFDTGASATPIIPVYFSDMETMMVMCKKLDQRGIFVNPILPPAVPPDRCLLRVSLMATHTQEQICRALDTFAAVGREVGMDTGGRRNR